MVGPNNLKIISFFCIFIALIFISSSLGQIAEDLNFIIKYNPLTKPEVKNDIYIAFYETSELKLLSLGMIRFYQICISTQQNNQVICHFTPSCSRFGFNAIQKYGVFYGILMTSDRLQRCHGIYNKQYPNDPITGKYIDPVDKYYLKIN